VWHLKSPLDTPRPAADALLECPGCAGARRGEEESDHVHTHRRYRHLEAPRHGHTRHSSYASDHARPGVPRRPPSNNVDNGGRGTPATRLTTQPRHLQDELVLIDTTGWTLLLSPE
jgi:hypothetical protein